MNEIPETLFDPVSPAEVNRRLDLFREQYVLGILKAAEFNAMLEEFKFQDAQGQTWSPGASTGQWYFWQDDQWHQAQPPTTLRFVERSVWFESCESLETTDRPIPLKR